MLCEALFGSLDLCEPIFLGQTVNGRPVKRAPLTKHQ